MSAPATTTRPGSTGATGSRNGNAAARLQARLGLNVQDWTPTNHNTWNGCVTDRDQNYDTLNTAPTASAPVHPVPRPSNTYCKSPAAPLQPIMPLSYDLDRAEDQDRLAWRPIGGTNQAIGLAWGWQSLTPSAPFNAPAEDAELHLQEGHHPDVRRPEHAEPLALRQRPTHSMARSTPARRSCATTSRPPASRSTRSTSTPARRSDLRRAAILRQRHRQVLHCHLGEPDHVGLQLDRNLAVETARRAIIPRKIRTRKKPGHDGRAF